jgi:hypothetical protein
MASQVEQSRWLLWDISIEKADQEEKKAYKEYIKFDIDKAAECRETFLDGLATALTKEGDKDRVMVVHQLKQQQKRCYIQ